MRRAASLFQVRLRISMFRVPLRSSMFRVPGFFELGTWYLELGTSFRRELGTWNLEPPRTSHYLAGPLFFYLPE